MKNVDRTANEYLHLYIALRRKKDNPDLQARCMREIIYDEEVSLKQLEARIKATKGVWRIHKTINKRCTTKAVNLLMHKLVDKPEETGQKLLSEWKTCLMRKEAKGERNILLDIDSLTAGLKIANVFVKNNITPIYFTPSVKGYHYVVKASDFDTRLVSNIPDVEILRDGYVFVKEIEGEK